MLVSAQNIKVYWDWFRLLNINLWHYGSSNLDLLVFLISNMRGGLLIFDMHKNCVKVIVIFGSNMTPHSFQMTVNFTQFLTPFLSVSIFCQIWPLPFQVADLLNGQSETMPNVWSHQKSTNHLLQNSCTRQSGGKQSFLCSVHYGSTGCEVFKRGVQN